MDAAWVEISRSALRRNLKALCDLSDGALVAPVVKANAYGHGMRECAEAFVEHGATMLCVNEPAEAAVLADLGARVYVVGPTFPDQADEIAAIGCEVVTASPEHVVALGRAGVARGVDVAVHVKVETGTQRQGLEPALARALWEDVRARPGVRLAGVCTHLADVEDETEHTFARVQLDRFEAAVAGLPSNVLRHCAASASHLLLPRSRFDLVRAGIACYGLWPSRETRIASGLVHGDAAPVLAPALSWRTRIAQVREAPTGSYVGYGRTLRVDRPTKIAVLPVGYWDGYVRALASQAHVLIRGIRAPVAGRICMNMCMVDVTDVVDVAAGDVVTLIGVDGRERITAEEVAAWSQTIHYEVTTRIHPRLPRRWVP